MVSCSYCASSIVCCFYLSTTQGNGIFVFIAISLRCSRTRHSLAHSLVTPNGITDRRKTTAETALFKKFVAVCFPFGTTAFYFWFIVNWYTFMSARINVCLVYFAVFGLRPNRMKIDLVLFFLQLITAKCRSGRNKNAIKITEMWTRAAQTTCTRKTHTEDEKISWKAKKKNRRNVSSLFRLFLDVDHLRREKWASSSSVKHFFCMFFTFPHFLDACVFACFFLLCVFLLSKQPKWGPSTGLNIWKISKSWIIFEIERNTGYNELTFFKRSSRQWRATHTKNALKSS